MLFRGKLSTLLCKLFWLGFSGGKVLLQQFLLFLNVNELCNDISSDLLALYYIIAMFCKLDIDVLHGKLFESLEPNFPDCHSTV